MSDIYRMLREEREYVVRPETANAKTKLSSTACVKTKIRRPKKLGTNKK